MKKGYSILSSGDCSDWGECILINEELGQLIKGELKADKLSKEIIHFLVNQAEVEESEIDEEFYNKSIYKSYIYHTLSNAVYEIKSLYVIEFHNIGQFANYVRENNIEIIDTLS